MRQRNRCGLSFVLAVTLVAAGLSWPRTAFAQWAVLHDKNGFAAGNVPDEASKTLAELARKGVVLKSISFAPGGGWVVLFDKNGLFARNIPDEAFKVLVDLAKQGSEVKSIAFTHDGGWAILHGKNSCYAPKIPDETFKAINDLAGQGAELKSLSFAGRPTIPLSRDDKETRDRVLERMAHYKVPGLSIAVIDNDQVKWARGYGVVKAGGSEPVTSNTRFQAASVSKPVTALAALRLVQDGKLALDDPLDKKLVSWKIPENDFTRKKKPTLRQVLDHSAGFSVHGFGGYEADGKHPTLLQVLDGAPPANSGPIRVEFVPGTKFQYSGGGYTVLQKLLMDVTRKPFPELMKELVLDPVGMKESSYQQPPAADVASHAAEGTSTGPRSPAAGTSTPRWRRPVSGPPPRTSRGS